MMSYSPPLKLMLFEQVHERENRELRSEMAEMTQTHGQIVEQMRAESYSRETDLSRQLEEVWSGVLRC